MNPLHRLTFHSVTTVPTGKLLQTAICDIKIYVEDSFPTDPSGVWFWEPGEHQPEDIPAGFRPANGVISEGYLFVILPGEPAAELTRSWLSAGAAGCLTVDQLDPKILFHWINERLFLLDHRIHPKNTILRSNEYIRQQQKFLRQIIDLNPNIIFVKDQESRFVLANKAQADAYQTTVDDLIGNTDSRYCVKQDESAFFLEKDREVLRTMKPVFIPEQTYTNPKTGEIIWYEMVKVPLTDANGQTFIMGVAVDITARKHHEIELRIARKKAEHADLLKSQFLANMSHEIRTPLNTILGFTELLREQSNDPVFLEYLGYIEKSGRSLLVLMNDIIDLSKIESGQMEIQHSHFSIRQQLQEIETLFAPKCQVKGLSLTVSAGEEVPDILEMDEKRLRQILVNLTDNAVKFTDEGEVEIRVTALPEPAGLPADTAGNSSKITLNISVRDTGIGISKKDQKEIFKKFQQQSGKDNRRYQQGTGLGLPITKRLAGLMNGEITVESKPGRGSTFTLLFREVASDDVTRKPEPSLSDPLHSHEDPVLAGFIGFEAAEFSQIKKSITIYGAEFWYVNHPDDAMDKMMLASTELVILNPSQSATFYQDILDHVKEYGIRWICLESGNGNPDPSWSDLPDAQGKMLSLKNGGTAVDQFLSQLLHQPDPGKYVAEKTDQIKDLNSVIHDRLIPQWNRLGNSLVINDIAMFAEELIQAGEELSIASFKQFGWKLKKETHRMDIDRIKQLLGQFQPLVKSLQQDIHIK